MSTAHMYHVRGYGWSASCWTHWVEDAWCPIGHSIGRNPVHRAVGDDVPGDGGFADVGGML